MKDEKGSPNPPQWQQRIRRNINNPMPLASRERRLDKARICASHVVVAADNLHVGWRMACLLHYLLAYSLLRLLFRLRRGGIAYVDRKFLAELAWIGKIGVTEKFNVPDTVLSVGSNPHEEDEAGCQKDQSTIH